MPIISKETWDNLIPAHEKEKLRQDYQDIIEAKRKISFTNDEISGAKYQMELIFGKENLQPQPLTYEDVVRELFKNGAWQFGDGYMNDEYGYFDESANETYSLNMTSQKQAEKLLAINKFLNVAKFLNKDWKPDWEDEDNSFYCLAIDPWDKDVIVTEVNKQRVSTEIVYFPTGELANKCVAILGEDTVRLALTTEY